MSSAVHRRRAKTSSVVISYLGTCSMCSRREPARLPRYIVPRTSHPGSSTSYNISTICRECLGPFVLACECSVLPRARNRVELAFQVEPFVPCRGSRNSEFPRRYGVPTQALRANVHNERCKGTGDILGGKVGGDRSPLFLPLHDTLQAGARHAGLPSRYLTRATALALALALRR